MQQNNSLFVLQILNCRLDKDSHVNAEPLSGAVLQVCAMDISLAPVRCSDSAFLVLYQSGLSYVLQRIGSFLLVIATAIQQGVESITSPWPASLQLEAKLHMVGLQYWAICSTPDRQCCPVMKH